MARPASKPVVCEGKKRFASKQAARRALSCIRGSGSVMHVYRCELGHWHLGHRDDRGGY